MWVRKSEQQMAAERSRPWLSFSGPAVLFVICFLADLGIALRGPFYPTGQGHWPVTWSAMLGGAAFVATVVAIATYILQLVLRRRLDPWAIHAKVVICDTCHRVKHRDAENKCECGGAFDDFNKWTWIGDEEAEEG
jgi:hypothetical protein